MFGIGGSELVVIALVAILVFGPGRIPEVMRSISAAYRELTKLRRQVDDTVAELRQEIDLKAGIYDELAGALRPPEGTRINTKGETSTAERIAEAGMPPPDPADPDDYLARSQDEPPVNTAGETSAPWPLDGDDYLAGEADHD
jgi:TatA/E family protein of Tat protein translocase